MKRNRVAAIVGLVIALIILIALPLNSSPFVNHQLALVAIFSVAILGLNIITGYAGQISLAQAAFFGMGAYAAAVSANAGWPIWAAFLLACVVPSLAGLAIAVPAVRLTGHALAMITLAVSLVAVPLANRLEGVTGGSQGLAVHMGDAPAWSGLADDQWGYYVTIVIAAVLFLLARNMIKGKVGRGLAIIRTNEVVAGSMGIPVRKYKTIAFTVAAGYAGAGGFLFAFSTQYVSPDTLGFLLGIMMLASLIIGGSRSLLGPVLGALFYVFVPDLAGTVSPEQSALIYGLALVLVAMFLPSGIAGAVGLAANRLKRRPEVARPQAIQGS